MLVFYLNQIVGHGFCPDREPETWCEQICSTNAPLVGGNEPRQPATAYYYQNGRRFSEGVRVLWALEDVNAGDGGFVLVPGSHKAYYRMPPGVRSCDDDMGTWPTCGPAGFLRGLRCRPCLGGCRERVIPFANSDSRELHVAPHVGLVHVDDAHR